MVLSLEICEGHDLSSTGHTMKVILKMLLTNSQLLLSPAQEAVARAKETIQCFSFDLVCFDLTVLVNIKDHNSILLS